MAKETIDIQLTPEECSLLLLEIGMLRYGYPFEQIEQAMTTCESRREMEIVAIDRFELERLIGDVCRSINQMKNGATQDQLLDLCERL